MLIVDDLLLFPVRGIFWIFREIHNAAQQEIAGEAESITAQLSELYMMLETKRITEQEFDEREKALLERLDKIQEYGAHLEDEDAEDEEEVENEEPVEDVEETESEE
jgi:hypothetical protein